MGFWNKVGRWVAWAAGLLFVIIGFNALWHGLDIIQVERGWTGVIAGTMAMSAGVLIILLTVLIDRIDALRHAVMTQRAVRFVEPAPFRMEPTGALDEPEPPKPVEVAVEPPVAATVAAAPAAFEFQSYMKRPVPAEEPRGEAGSEPERPAPAPEPALESPPEQVRRFAPPQFRRPTVVQPPPDVDELAPTQPEAEPELEPEAELAASHMPEPEPVEAAQPPVEIEVTQTTVSVEASITEAIVEELRLPRASNLQSFTQPTGEAEQIEPLVAEPEPVAEPVAEREPEPGPESITEAEPERVPEPLPLRESAPPPRDIAQTHVWLEKALNDDEEPALDWLRQRRGGEGRAERNVPSFMRRHVATETERVEAAVQPYQSEPQQPEPQQSEPVVEPETVRPSGAPGVVGRYAANGSDYTLYADGSIDAQTPDGPRHFASMDELRGFLQQQNEATAG